MGLKESQGKTLALEDTHTHTRTHAHPHTRTHTHARTHARTYIHEHIHTHAQPPTHIHTPHLILYMCKQTINGSVLNFHICSFTWLNQHHPPHRLVPSLMMTATAAAVALYFFIFFNTNFLDQQDGCNIHNPLPHPTSPLFLRPLLSSLAYLLPTHHQCHLDTVSSVL